jgi:hypothetical protein
MLRMPHCLDIWLTDIGQVVSPTHWPRPASHKHYFSVSGTHSCQRLSKLQRLVRLEGLGKLGGEKKKKNHSRPRVPIP